ncbi:hypothetical protein [Nocardia sp. NPDC050717]|uniref:hypothetical protein n=1 Tax=Nocardia sp. NPDC050717 TaxID=3157221 RepID=UPI0033E0847C
MDQDRIKAQVDELADLFDVQAPPVRLGEVPDWCADGVHPQWIDTQIVLVVGPAFDALTPDERRGALAEAVLSSKLQISGQFKLAMITLTVTAALYLITGQAAEAGLLPASAWWLRATLATIGGVLLFLTAYVVHTRRIIYRVDQRMSQILGADTVAATLELDERSRDSAGFLLELSIPSKNRRLQRLTGTTGRP